MPRSPDAAIREVLARYPPVAQPADRPKSLGGAGGLSGARLWRYRSGLGVLVLRLWPPHGPGRAHLEQVHRWLLATGDLGFVPVPIADRSGRTLQEYGGGLWELAPWMPGTSEDARPPAPTRVRSAFAALAAFHQRLASERRTGASPGLGHRHEEVARLLQGGFDALERAIRGSRDDDRPLAMRGLGLARAAAPRLLDPLRGAAARAVPLQPCLRDARPEHFLFEGDRVSGLVDFGAMGVDCVAGDLARLIVDWLDGDSSARAAAMLSYERTRPLDVDEAALIDAFTSSTRLLMGERWIRWRYVEARHFEDPSSVGRGIARGLARLEPLSGGGSVRISARE